MSMRGMNPWRHSDLIDPDLITTLVGGDRMEHLPGDDVMIDRGLYTVVEVSFAGSTEPRYTIRRASLARRLLHLMRRWVARRRRDRRLKEAVPS